MSIGWTCAGRCRYIDAADPFRPVRAIPDRIGTRDDARAHTAETADGRIAREVAITDDSPAS
jgi:hypothetical protein